MAQNGRSLGKDDTVGKIDNIVSHEEVINIQKYEGMRFGKWVVIRRDVETISKDIRWICKCDCGTEKSVLGKYLKNGKSTSCGCNKKTILNGKRFGALTVIDTLFGYNGYNKATYKCICDCGNTIYVKSTRIYKQKSCGCSRTKDITGRRYGKLVVSKMLYSHGTNGETYCECLCDCGNTLVTRANALVTGNTRSCGCIHSPSLIGKQFGRLNVIGRSDDNCWICKCCCGQTITVPTKRLNNGNTTSCGCARSDRVSTGEQLIRSVLNKNGIKYIPEKTFQKCKGVGGRRLRFDFYIPCLNTIIEYDGEQHYSSKEWFGGDSAFKTLRENDSIKNDFCKENGINLVRIPYYIPKDEVIRIIETLLSNPVTITVA